MQFLAAVGLLASLAISTPVSEPVPETKGSRLIRGDSNPSRFKFYPNPTPLTGPCDITTGPDGNLWTQNILDNTVSKYDLKTGQITNYPVPYSPDQLYNASIPETGRISAACAIQPGNDGFLYAGTGIRSQMLKINPATGFIKVFTPPLPNVPLLGNLQPFNDLWRGETGLWYTLTTAGTLYHFDYKTETFDGVYPLPTPLNGVLGCYVASDGNVWLAEFLAQKVAFFNPKTKKFTEIPLQIPEGLTPGVIRAETKGPNGERYIWFTGFAANTNIRVNIAPPYKVDYYYDPLPLSFPTVNTADNQNRMWYSTTTRNTIQFLDANNDANVIEIPGNLIPGLPISLPPGVDISIHYHKPTNVIAFSQVALNRIGTYQL